MTVYISRDDSAALTHYGVKGMKWHKHLKAKAEDKDPYTKWKTISEPYTLPFDTGPGHINRRSPAQGRSPEKWPGTIRYQTQQRINIRKKQRNIV